MTLYELDDETLRTIHKGRIVVHVIVDDHYILMTFADLDVNCEKGSLLVIPMSRLYFSLSGERVIFGKIHLQHDKRLIARFLSNLSNKRTLLAIAMAMEQKDRPLLIDFSKQGCDRAPNLMKIDFLVNCLPKRPRSGIIFVDGIKMTQKNG
jgi:hypothetical protein